MTDNNDSNDTILKFLILNSKIKEGKSIFSYVNVNFRKSKKLKLVSCFIHFKFKCELIYWKRENKCHGRIKKLVIKIIFEFQNLVMYIETEMVNH